jgi:segregation and condensation protein A
VLAPRPAPTVSTAHLHVPRTSVREQAEILLARLRSLRRATFRQLIADCAGTYEVVARFLAVLELFRDGQVSLDQAAPFGDLLVTWTGEAGREPARDLEEYDG